MKYKYKYRRNNFNFLDFKLFNFLKLQFMLVDEKHDVQRTPSNLRFSPFANIHLKT